MQELKVPLDGPYKKLTEDLLNVIFGNTTESTEYWNSTLRPHAEQKFNFSITAVKGAPIADIKQILKFSKQTLGHSLYFMLKSFKKLIGFDLSSRELKSWKSNPDHYFGEKYPFSSEIFKGIGQKVKHMSIVNFSLGYVYKLQASHSGAQTDKQIFIFEKSLASFEKALESNPNSVITMRNCALVSSGIYFTKRYLSKDLTTPTCFDPLIERTKQHFKNALLFAPNDYFTLRDVGFFMGQCGKKVLALEYFLKAFRIQREYEVVQEILDLLQEVPNTIKAQELLKKVAYELGKLL